LIIEARDIVGEELNSGIVNVDDFLDELTLEKRRSARGSNLPQFIEVRGCHNHLYVKNDNREFKTLTSALM